MARSNRDRFLRERDRVGNIADDDVRLALLDFADALDEELDHIAIPTFEQGTFDGHETQNNNTAKNYLSALRCAYERGLDLLNADVETVNDFMSDLVREPGRRRHDLVGPPTPGGKESPKKASVKTWQSALRAFYRYCTEPESLRPNSGEHADRPDVAVDWESVNGSKHILMFSERSTPMYDSDDMSEQADIDALREACLQGQNTRRDRAFLELAAGTGQRVYALVTLRVGDVHLDPTDGPPHVMLNPEIENDGDKGAIENTGRFKPIVSDTDPIKQWIQHHPFQDPDVRAEHGAPDDFEDCYLFVGSLRQRSTDTSGHWGTEAARNMLERRKADTETMPGVKTVDVPVKPHNWRHYAYTKSQDLPISESKRRDVFGWKAGSTTGDDVYGHVGNQKSGEDFAEAYAEMFGDESGVSVAEQIVGEHGVADLSPESKQALVQELVDDDNAVAELTETIMAAVTESCENPDCDNRLAPGATFCKDCGSFQGGIIEEIEHNRKRRENADVPPEILAQFPEDEREEITKRYREASDVSVHFGRTDAE